MTPLEHLGADDLRAVVRAYRDGLRAHQASINRLNVYPVPDGDTGTNMALTVESVLAELDGAGDDMASVCQAIAHGSLMGARGNSGVILSQILRGMTATFAAAEVLDGAAFAQGLSAAAEGAYQAVGRPVEGTILTVVREAAEAAQGAATADDGTEPSLEGVLDAARHRGGQALDRTPELLEVLRQAGVVDAGGAGLLLLLDAALHVVTGRPVPAPATCDGPAAVPHGIEGHDGESRAGDDGEGGAELRYEVMYLLEAPDDAMAEFRRRWAELGDSIVVVGGEGMWNCHIHTDDIGGAVEAGIEAGRPRQVRVTDLHEQVEEERWVREGVEAGRAPAAEVQAATSAVVAVATGEGVRQLFTSLGVGSVVSGGQSMNPSTAQLLEAVEASACDQVVILPNNTNIVAVAEQVDGLTVKVVRVVPTRGIPEGLAALLGFHANADANANAEAMAATAAGVTTAEVTRAVRSSHCDAGPIAEGDWLGIGPDGIEVVEASPDGAATGLLSALVGGDHELVTLIEGEDAPAEGTATITRWLAEHHPGLDVEVHQGGQPLYPYLLGIE